MAARFLWSRSGHGCPPGRWGTLPNRVKQIPGLYMKPRGRWVRSKMQSHGRKARLKQRTNVCFLRLFWENCLLLECCCCRQNQFNSADKPDYPIPCLSLSSALSISSAFLWFWGEIAKMTRHAHRDWQPYCSAVFFWGGGEGRLCRSDLTVSVRRVTTLRSFYTEETHSTEEGYPDRLTG